MPTCWFSLRGQRYEYEGPLPSKLPAAFPSPRWPYPGTAIVPDIELKPGRFLNWLLADPCTIHLDMGLWGARQNETEAQKAERLARRKRRLAAAGEAARAKSLQI